MKRKTSPIWNYFIDINKLCAQCKICEKIYSRKGRTTTALKSHLKAKHVEMFAEFEMLDKFKLPLEVSKQEETVSTRFEFPKPSTSYSEVQSSRTIEVPSTSTEDFDNSSNFSISEEDECLILTKGYSTKMRKLTPEQLMFADKLISDTLYYGQMGLLNKNCTLSLNSQSMKLSPNWNPHTEEDL